MVKLYGEVSNIKGREEHERRVAENGVIDKFKPIVRRGSVGSAL